MVAAPRACTPTQAPPRLANPKRSIFSFRFLHSCEPDRLFLLHPNKPADRPGAGTSFTPRQLEHRRYHITLFNSPNPQRSPSVSPALRIHNTLLNFFPAEFHLIAPDPAYSQPPARCRLYTRHEDYPGLQVIRVTMILLSSAFFHIADLPNIERVNVQFCLYLDRPCLYEPLTIPSLKTFEVRFQGTDAWNFAPLGICTLNLGIVALKFKGKASTESCPLST